MMFGSILSFCNRHRRKFIATGVILGGGWALTKYVKYKVKQLMEAEDVQYLTSARKQHHFDSNQRTCNLTVLSMIPNIREIILKNLNSQFLRDQLKLSPPNKVQLWEQLKVLCFARCLSAVYASSLLSLLLRVQLNVIGGYLYVDSANEKPINGQDTKESRKVPQAVQERYISLAKYFLGPGLVELIRFIKQAVDKEISSLSLKERLSLTQVHNIISQVRQHVECGVLGLDEHIPTMPLCQYLLPGEQIPDIELVSRDERLFENLVNATRDILESTDFHVVLHSSLERGFSHLLDCLADHYKHNTSSGSVLVSLHEAAIPVAKLIPVLDGLPNRLCCDTPNPYFQELLLLEDVKNLAANIYEAFTQIK